MTVYPFVVQLGGFTITGYGLMMMAAFLVAGWIFAVELERGGFSPDIAWDSVVWAVVGGIGGAKLYYALLVGRWDALFSRSGLVWYGGFIGGAGAVLLYLWWKRHPVARIGDLISPALAAAYAVGRVGCFLVGDDYGVPTSLPWGVRFPQGSPPSTAAALRADFGVAIPPGTPDTAVMAVHPTQLYEVGLALVVFAALWRLRERERAAGRLLGLWFVLMGLERALVELFRAKDDRFFGPFTLAQAISAAMVVVGGWLLARRTGAPADRPAGAAA